MDFEKIVVVTKKTALEELVERFNTREQARFYLEHAGASFDDYQAAHDQYQRARDTVAASLPKGLKYQFIERAFLPTFLFTEKDLVVTLGPDGLVVNTAKYLTTQPLLALNPDTRRIDGVLVPFEFQQAAFLLNQAVRGKFKVTQIAMAQAALNDGQTLFAVNDLFIGVRTHISALYRLRFRGREEDQSSSGIIVSTGAGSTGWFRSILTGASRVIEAYAPEEAVRDAREKYRFDWQADYVYFSVREPFVSKVSSAELVFGRIEANESLEIVSQMPQNGIIFSDGIEADFLEFNSGASARVGLAERRVQLIAP